MASRPTCIFQFTALTSSQFIPPFIMPNGKPFPHSLYPMTCQCISPFIISMTNQFPIPSIQWKVIFLIITNGRSMYFSLHLYPEAKSFPHWLYPITSHFQIHYTQRQVNTFLPSLYTQRQVIFHSLLRMASLQGISTLRIPVVSQDISFHQPSGNLNYSPIINHPI